MKEERNMKRELSTPEEQTEQRTLNRAQGEGKDKLGLQTQLALKENSD